MKHILAFLALSGCAAAIQVGPAGPDPDPVVIGEGTIPSNEINVLRPSEAGLATQLLTSPAILLDGRSVGTCRIGAPILLRVPDGTWTITAMTENGRVDQRVTVSGGESKTLRCGASAVPPLGPKPVLEPL